MKGREWRIDGRLLIALALYFVLHRLLFLHADPSGIYMNTDEGLHTHDARNIVLYGTAFYDSYTPSALMPVSTWLKVPFLALFGVNLYGVRIPSVLATVGAALLIAWAFCKRRESLTALLVSLYCGLSFFDFSHARIGVQDTLLACCAAAAVFFLDRALREARAGDYALAALCASCAPFIKTSGVFVPAALGLTLIGVRLTDKGRLSRRGLALAGIVAASVLAFLALFWFIPHWALTRRYFMWEVASRKTPSPLLSAAHILRELWQLSPMASILFALGLGRFLRQGLVRRLTVDHLDALLFSWFFCAGATLIYSSLLYWRWAYWLFLPFVALAARELVRLMENWSRNLWKPWLPAAAVTLFIAPLLWADLPRYIECYRTMTFYIWDTTSQVEAIVGGSQVSGSGWENFALNSRRINHVSSFDYSGFGNCWKVQRAFPTPGKMPRFVSVYAGADAKLFPVVISGFYNGCPQWASQYRVFGAIKKLQPPGADIWFVRK